jgi:hypothetical protein
MPRPKGAFRTLAGGLRPRKKNQFIYNFLLRIRDPQPPFFKGVSSYEGC